MSEGADTMVVAGQATRLAPRQDERIKVRLGAADDTSPDVLTALASDESVLVRTAVALNGATPGQTDRALTADPDDRVRMVLARKLATLLPSLSSAEQASLARQAWDNLALLVRDEANRVRALVADLLKEQPGAPRELILLLAGDASFMVSDPVLRLSPVLTQEDLLTLLTAPPQTHTAHSIARRHALDPALCDAVVATADTDAIRILLQNRSAAIREETLDRVVARAAQQTDWHEPLVLRPMLSSRSIRLLADFVADRLVGALAGRLDLDPAVLPALRARLEHEAPAPGGRARETSWADQPDRAAASWRSEASLIEAIRLGETARITMMIAASAGVTMEEVRHGAKLRSARAAVSLLWKGGYSMRAAAAVQALLFNLTPDGMLRAGPDGGFPLSEADMTAQLGLLKRGAGG